jgi:uncharacterized membrane protein HdeD (DUF308 family)
MDEVFEFRVAAFIVGLFFLLTAAAKTIERHRYKSQKSVWDWISFWILSLAIGATFPFFLKNCFPFR